ncbi:MAG: hypothetical protein NC313_16525 [Butyrivibrio sp.]|nr:hypothetical protein [Butyrivibrio sp.]
MNNELITLITVLEEKRSKSGFLEGEETVETEIFAGIKSVGRTEFYEALRNGIKVVIMFEVDPDDFKLAERKIEVDGAFKKISASKVIYDDILYLIHRTYLNKAGKFEVTCREVE